MKANELYNIYLCLVLTTYLFIRNVFIYTITKTFLNLNLINEIAYIV